MSEGPLPLPASVLVTGASGFIGRAVSDHFREWGADVHGLDTAPDPDRGVEAGDVTDAASCRRSVEGCDLIVHTAAVVTNNVDPAAAWAVNVVGTQRLLEAAVAAGVSRFVLLSTMGVARFAQREAEAVERYLPGRALDETWPVMPVGNPYTDTKIAAEHLVLAAQAREAIDCTIVRPTEVYGPRSRPWVLEPVAAIRQGLFLLPAHGEGLFNPIYVDDLVEGIVAAGCDRAAVGHILQLGGDETVTTAEYFDHLYRMLGREGPPRSVPTGVAIAVAEVARLGFGLVGRPTELGRGVMEMLAKTRPVSSAKAREVLGWQPRVTLAEGMARTERWLREEGILSG